MGAIRLILAIAVVINHTGPIFGYTLLRGNVAVQSFYILSGFFMAFILEEKYFQTKSPFKFFITNRILRIFPIYWSILAIVFIICLISIRLGGKPFYFEPYLKYSSNLNFLSWGYLIVSQIVLFFQDAILFLGLNTTNGNFYYIPYLYSTQPVVFHFLIVPQAWTLGLELSFYLLAPFLLRLKNSIIIPIILLCFLLKIKLYFTGYFVDPWIYWFFPMELGFFLMGSLAYRFSKNINPKFLAFSKPIFFAILIIIAIFSLVEIRPLFKIYAFYASFILSIPFIFSMSKSNSFDLYLGELSFPVYLSHHFILTIFIPIFQISQQLKGIATILLSIIFSMLLLKFLIKPLNNYRQKRIKNNNIIYNNSK